MSPQLELFQRVIWQDLPAIRAHYHLDRWEREQRADLARAMELVLAEMDRFTGELPLRDWLLVQARRAVEERVVQELLRAGPTLARCYCRDVLAERVAYYHAHYWLELPVRERRAHEREAERAMDERLATYTGTPAPHRWMRRLAHREDAERGNIQCLDDWLGLIARLTVERYVVAEMLRQPDSPLMRLNLIWVARRVGWRHETRCGEPNDPRESVEAVWMALLAPVPEPLHERIRDHTDRVVMRILKGLPSFRFDSTLDTWRMTVLQNTMNSMLRRKSPVAVVTLPFSALASDGGWEIEEHEPALADDGLSLQTHVERVELEHLLRAIIRLALSERPEAADIIRLRLEGVKPGEVARLLDVDVETAYREFYDFKRRVRRISREMCGGDPAAAI